MEQSKGKVKALIWILWFMGCTSEFARRVIDRNQNASKNPNISQFQADNNGNTQHILNVHEQRSGSTGSQVEPSIPPIFAPESHDPPPTVAYLPNNEVNQGNVTEQDTSYNIPSHQRRISADDGSDSSTFSDRNLHELAEQQNYSPHMNSENDDH